MIVLLKVSAASHEDIRERIAALGPIYTRDFFRTDREHGLVIVLGEVGLVKEERTGNVRTRTEK